MKLLNFIPALAVLATAFVLPDEQVFGDLAVESHRKPDTGPKKVPCSSHLWGNIKGAWQASKHALDDALASIEGTASLAKDNIFETGVDVKSWLESSIDSDVDIVDGPDHPGPPHHGPPGKEPPHHGPPGKGPRRGRPGRRPKRPHHPPHHHKGNQSIYELISKSKYTTKLAKLIDEDSELVELLNSTKANFTLFAPTDHAFSKIPQHGHTPSKEFIKKVLLYHISPGLFPAGRLLFTHTVPTLLNETLLGDKPQRLVAKVGLKGVAINFYSRVVAVNIPATNGIIHGVDSILIPPPKAIQIINLLPGEFSTLLLGLGKTGLDSALNSTHHTGGTIFAPSNTAFKKLGPRINAFLFSKFGEKYLKALLEYHVVANYTLYSNTLYAPTSHAALDGEMEEKMARPPYVHLDLPTLLEDKSLAIDLTRYGPFISFKINGFVKVVVQDGLAKDGVIQVVSDVLIPPKSVGGPPPVSAEYWEGGEMSLEEFKERLGPLVGDDMDQVEGDEEWKIDL